MQKIYHPSHKVSKILKLKCLHVQIRAPPVTPIIYHFFKFLKYLSSLISDSYLIFFKN